MKTSVVSTQSSGGCFKYGCIIAVILAVALFGGIYFYLRYSIKNAVLTYTEPTKVEVVRANIVSAEERSVAAASGIKEYENLLTQLSLGGGAGQKNFTFTPVQLEEVIRARLGSGTGGGDVVIEGEGDSILLGVSIPAAPLVAFRDFLGPLVTFDQERFFNGKAKLSLAVVDGTPKVTVKALTLAGKELPEMGLTSASASLEGYLRDAINDASGVSLNKVKSLAVVDGKIVIELR